MGFLGQNDISYNAKGQSCPGNRSENPQSGKSARKQGNRCLLHEVPPIILLTLIIVIMEKK